MIHHFFNWNWCWNTDSISNNIFVYCKHNMIIYGIKRTIQRMCKDFWLDLVKEFLVQIGSHNIVNVLKVNPSQLKEYRTIQSVWSCSMFWRDMVEGSRTSLFLQLSETDSQYNWMLFLLHQKQFCLWNNQIQNWKQSFQLFIQQNIQAWTLVNILEFFV